MSKLQTRYQGDIKAKLSRAFYEFQQSVSVSGIDVGANVRLQLLNDMNRLDRLDAESETDRIEGEERPH